MVAGPDDQSRSLSVRREMGARASLRGDQARTLELLVTGKSVAETARSVGIDRTTIYYWLRNDPVFLAAYNEWREVLKASCQARLMAMAERAASAVEQQLERGDGKLGWAVLKEMKLVSEAPALPSQSTDPEVVRKDMEIQRTFEGTIGSMRAGDAKGSLKTLLGMAEGKVPELE